MKSYKVSQEFLHGLKAGIKKKNHKKCMRHCLACNSRNSKGLVAFWLLRGPLRSYYEPQLMSA